MGCPYPYDMGPVPEPGSFGWGVYRESMVDIAIHGGLITNQMTPSLGIKLMIGSIIWTYGRLKVD